MVRLDSIYTNHVVLVQARPHELQGIGQLTDIEPPDVAFAKIALADQDGEPVNVPTLVVEATPKSELRVIDALPVTGGSVWLLRVFGGRAGFGYPLTLTAEGYAPILVTAVVRSPVGPPVYAVQTLRAMRLDKVVDLLVRVDGQFVPLLAVRVLQ